MSNRGCKEHLVTSPTHRTRYAWLLAFLVTMACLPTACFASDAVLPRIVTHDNRVAAGKMSEGVLHLGLQITEGEWYPEAEEGPHITVYAFAESGKAPMVPGPLIRVSAGVQIDVSVKNTASVTLVMHGLQSRPGNDVPVTLSPGEEHEFKFAAGSPGTYYYWAAPPGRSITEDPERRGMESQLSGALIADDRGTVPADGIFVIGLWRHITRDNEDADVEFGTINGKAWPYTERVALLLGSSAQWRWINASSSNHPMHLHGAYYRLDASGDGVRDETYPPGQRQMIVTRNMTPGTTMNMDWTAEHPGHWLFHCHIIAHFAPESSLSAFRDPKFVHHMGASGMAGLVLAIDVDGPAGTSPAVYQHPRRLTLLLDEPVAKKEIRLELLDGNRSLPSAGLMGPPIVLRRGEATAIKVVNRLPEQTAIHWHGMELESYYDGVPDFSGVGPQITPPIAAGKSFVARMTPMRAGTFIYHTHWHDVDQLTEGLYGPLLVLQPEQKYDPEQDVAFVAGLTVKDTDGPLLINGLEHPEVSVRAGQVRLRLINITPNNTGLIFTLTSAGKKHHWRSLAKDGMDLPAALQRESESVQQVGVGETYDFEISAHAGEELEMEGFLPGPKKKSKATIHVH